MRTPFLLLLLISVTARAGLPVPPAGPTPPPKVGGEYKSLHLYTSPEPAASGGLHLISPIPLECALAVPQSDQQNVYQATLGPDHKDITFPNIPISKYDVVFVTKDHFYEGISLNRDENSLSPDDLKAIDIICTRSVPFFDVKRTDMVKGTPGDNGHATALVQWMRIHGRLLNQNADEMIGHEIRSLRLVFLADVGPGWQVTATRELLRTDAFPDMTKGFFGVTYVDALNGIRVTDSVKDVGPVDISGTPVSAPAPSP